MSHGFIPWGDSQHISQTAGEIDGFDSFLTMKTHLELRKLDLPKTFETTEIIEVPNSVGNHSSSL
jgi:nitrous-oxide reductase